ncbi:MAG: hypothetical protein ACE5FS_07465, partial [Paracoccaceae bacterium]
MPLRPSSSEHAARARADLRIGVPVLLCGGGSAAIVCAAETVSRDRLSALRALGGVLDLAITARRAETLRARSYDGDLARVAVPDDADTGWIRATADPSRDLEFPMKGPYQSRREGPADLHRAVLRHLIRDDGEPVRTPERFAATVARVEAHLLPTAAATLGT